MTRVSLLLLVGVLAVVAIERKPWNELRDATLFLRIKSWAVIAPLFLVTLFSGGFPAFLLAAFITLQASAEYGRLVRMDRKYAVLLAVWALVGLLVAAFVPRFLLLLPLAFFLLLTLMPIVSGRVEGAHRQVTATLFGYIYIGLPMAYFVFIKGVESWGREFLLIVGVAVALSDVLAFVVGSLLKGPKLAPKVSPGKTWAGVLGNVLGAVLGVLLLSIAIPAEWAGAGIVTMTLVIAIGALWGDLTESFVKRDFAVKDAGTLLPGFGGILDRVDSFLLAMPLAYYGLLIGNRIAG
ncbi:MAG TPA: CDP-archaeol synthase [Actinomycetota bacterium]|nr:CDP-archaeol synthase [Actinomycetota bacterium]